MPLQANFTHNSSENAKYEIAVLIQDKHVWIWLPTFHDTDSPHQQGYYHYLKLLKLFVSIKMKIIITWKT